MLERQKGLFRKSEAPEGNDPSIDGWWYCVGTFNGQGQILPKRPKET